MINPSKLILILLAAAVLPSPTHAARQKPTEPARLTAQGKAAEADYTSQLEALKDKILKELPSIDPARKNAFLNARQAEVEATAKLKKAQQAMAEIQTAKALVAHAKGKWIGGAKRGIQTAHQLLEKANSPKEQDAAKRELVKWQQNLKEGEQALKERLTKQKEAEARKPELERALTQAEESLTKSKASTLVAFQNLKLGAFLSKDSIDAELAKYSMIKEATPQGLARFSQQGVTEQQWIDKLLSSQDLLVDIAVADGASGHRYGEAMRIYHSIWQSSDKVAEGPLPKLALAISLEHASPVKQRNAVAKVGAPAFVDPVKRYLHYERAFLANELDPAFAKLSVWDYRMVVNGEEPDEILSWGRTMLRNYRPDHVTNSDYRWRYVGLVRSDIQYGSQDNKFDQDELQFFQNILMNGGVCGRRAFFGRFILRAFGIPTTARPSRGHAALAHWTPDGWVVCLGGGWGAGWTKTRYDRDIDFLANTQTRATGDSFMQVKRAQWIGDLMNEPQVFGLHSRKQPHFWYAVSLYTQLELIKAVEAKTLAAVGEDIGEANETKEPIPLPRTQLKDTDQKITLSDKGIITIPACATSQPSQSNRKILFMDSFLGGKQLLYSRNGGAQTFAYSLDVPKAGRYALSARVATPSWKQSLQVSVNGAAQRTTMPLPFTVGMWETSQPVTVELTKGKNLLTFDRQHPKLKGVTIRDFTLTPLD